LTQSGHEWFRIGSTRHLAAASRPGQRMKYFLISEILI
jgi:hypothetical protein